MPQLTIGQFSRSPVLAAAAQLGWDAEAGLTIRTHPATSSPAQFESLSSGEIDVALTSPDNVMLYATTSANPLKSQLPLRMHRSVDGGLGLALVVRPEISGADELREWPIGVDVLPSGFAMLLKDLLHQVGLDPAVVNFVEVGGTPKRVTHLLDGDIGATILNAESRVRAEAAGMAVWRTSADVSASYPGTVLATMVDGPDLAPLLGLWERTTAWLLDTDTTEVGRVLGEVAPELGDPAYLALMRDPATGLRRNPGITLAQLDVLAELRRRAGAYAPSEEQLRQLATE